MIFKILTSKCVNCKSTSVKYIGDEWTGFTWISIYECGKCNKTFI